MNKRTPNMPQTLAVLALLSTATTVAGCGRTLLFVDHDGVNFAIRADASSTPPLEVNFGLNRTVASVVPATKSTNEGAADGNAVNMFASFDVNYAANADATKPFSGTLMIDNQFASGKAAKNIAETNPEVVPKIVNPNREVTRTSADALAMIVPAGITRQDALLTAIAGLPDATAISLAQNPPVTNAPLDQAIAAMVQANGPPTAPQARQILKRRIVLASGPAELSKWESAFKN